MENKSDYAYQELKNRIISGQMPPLSDVSEEQLQKELGVSRTPIREAIQKLEKKETALKTLPNSPKDIIVKEKKETALKKADRGETSLKTLDKKPKAIQKTEVQSAKPVTKKPQ